VSYHRLPGTEASWQWTAHPSPPLELGREIEATVVQRLPDGSWLLDIEGVWVAAEEPGGLEVGQRLRLHVEQLQPQVVLLITEKESAVDGEAARLWARMFLSRSRLEHPWRSCRNNWLHILSQRALETPPEVYRAVAEILGFVYRVANKKLGR
jgi:hypothetical protein